MNNAPVTLEQATSLLDLSFVDMIIGPDYAELRELEGSPSLSDKVPGHLQADVSLLRQQCRQALRTLTKSEFTATLGEEKFRVTQLFDVDSQDIFILARADVKTRPLKSLGMADRLFNHLTQPKLSGLIVVSGGMRHGKTSTADAIFIERLERHGGLRIALADPPETSLNGMHGRGRAIQIEVAREHGGYQEQLMRGLRSRANIFYLGETRDSPSAIEVVRVSGNGWPVLTTLHADSPELTFTKLQSLCGGSGATVESFNAMLADNISAVIHQQLETVKTATGSAKRLQINWLVLDGKEDTAIRAKIRKGDFAGLNTEIAAQKAAAIFGSRT